MNFLVIPVVQAPQKEWGPDSPLVSVLIPARNEGRNIGPCLESLLAQDYPNLEIIALNDRSEDGTGEIIEGLCASSGGRLRMISGRKLPAGWVGKNWACHQLYQEAKGDILIFTDADTVHQPWCISGAVETCEETGAGLVSLWPRQITKTWAEKLILPVIYFLGAGFMCHLVSWMARRADWFRKTAPAQFLANFGGANGQFMCFTRAGYQLVGGHEGLKDDIVEDLRFGREMMAKSAQGGKLVNADGKGALSCRMYNSFSEVWEGFSKNIWPAFHGNRALYLTTGLVIFVLTVLPFFALPFSSGAVFTVVCLQIAVILTVRLLLALRWETSILGAVLHLPAMLLAMAIGANSGRLGRKGKLTWKGRMYNQTGGESGN